MSSAFFDSYFRDTAEGAINVASDSFKILLVTSAYTLSKAHAKRSDITSEVSGTGYTAGGTAIAITRNLDTTNHRYDLTLTSVNWPGATITARGGVVYKARGGAASADELVGYLDFGSDIASTAGTFTVNASTPWRVAN